MNTLFCRFGMDFLLPVQAFELYMQCHWLGSGTAGIRMVQAQPRKIVPKKILLHPTVDLQPPRGAGNTRDRVCAEHESHKTLMTTIIRCLRACCKLWVPLIWFFKKVYDKACKLLSITRWFNFKTHVSCFSSFKFLDQPKGSISWRWDAKKWLYLWQLIYTNQKFQVLPPKYWKQRLL